jgi:urea carboxylase
LLKLPTSEGAQVEAGDDLAIIEAMKMECRFIGPISGRVRKVCLKGRRVIEPGSAMPAIEPA